MSLSLGSVSNVHKSTDVSNTPLGDVKAFGINLTKPSLDNPPVGGRSHSLEELKSIPQGLLKKASPDELSTLHKLFSPDRESTQGREPFAALIKENRESFDKTIIRSQFFLTQGSHIYI